MHASRCFSLLLAAFALSFAAHAQTTYRLTYIDGEVGCTQDMTGCVLTITDINENGEMVGSTELIGGVRVPRAVLLRDGMVIELGDLMGGASPFAVASAINDLTQITGLNQIQDASGNLVARGFLWEDGQIRDLDVDGDTSASDINNHAQIVGGVVAGNVGRPFLWEAGRTTILDTVACPGLPGGTARAINEHGVIVGSVSSTSSFPGSRAVMWRDGQMVSLEPPFPLETGSAGDVNDRGDVIGSYFTGNDGPSAAFVWEAGQTIGTELPPLDRFEVNFASPGRINNQGQIVGDTHDGAGHSLATLWQDGAVLDLNELVSEDDPAKAFVTLIRSVAINDAGVIVAQGIDSRVGPGDRDEYFLLTPSGALAVAPSPPDSSSRPGDNGGGAVDLVSLLLLTIVMSASAACTRGRQRHFRRFAATVVFRH